MATGDTHAFSSVSAVERVARWLGGMEQVGERALPVEEFAHPYPLLAMALLGVNDHVLKGSGWMPGWLTGKLSDFAGLFFFPLFVTAALDTLLYALFRLSGNPKGRGWCRPDYSLNRRKLLAAVGLTTVLFAPLKLSEGWANLYIQAMHLLDFMDLFGGFAVTRDPTDLVALLVLPLAYLHGRRYVRRVPIGRLQVLSCSAAHAQQGKERNEPERQPRTEAHLETHDGQHHHEGSGPRSVDPRSSQRSQRSQRSRMIQQGLRDVRDLASGRPGAVEALDRFAEAFAGTLDGRSQRADRSRRHAQRLLDRYRFALERPS